MILIFFFVPYFMTAPVASDEQAAIDLFWLPGVDEK
jgi:hypothetical protein